MVEKGGTCSVALHMAIAAVAGNEELMKRLANIAEESNQDAIFSDMLKQGADIGVEGDIKTVAHEYSLKQESNDIKFKSLLFSAVLANTNQGDEALRELVKAIEETGGTYSEGLDLLYLASRLDLSQMEEVAKAINGDIKDAKKFVDNMRKKIAAYIATNYSVVSTRNPLKPGKTLLGLRKKVEEGEKLLENERNVLGDAFDDIDKDLKELQTPKKGKPKYWSFKEGKARLNELKEKYGKKDMTKIELEEYLTKIKKLKTDVKSAKTRLKNQEAEFIKALEEDKKAIEDGQNPFKYVGADSEWKFIKGFNGNTSKRVLEYGQYVLARTLLNDGGDIPTSIYKAIIKTIEEGTKGKVGEGTGIELSEDWLMNEDRTLDELLARAYTNGAQLANDGNLRMLYRQRLIELASEGQLSLEDVEYVRSLVETMRFAGEGAGFGTIVKYTNLLANARELLGREAVKVDGKTLWKDIVDFFEDLDFDVILARTDVIKLKHGTELNKRQLLELVSGMTGDINIYKLIVSNNYTDSEILGVAGKYLTGNATIGRKRLESLIGEIKKNPTTDDARGIIIKTLTGKDVAAGTKVGFFDTRRELSAAEDVKERAKFRDRIAEANKIYIPGAGISDLTTTNKSSLIAQLEAYKGGFIIVSDSQWRTNSVLVGAIDEINLKAKTPEEKIQVIAPKGGLSGMITHEGDMLVFKTSYSSVYDTIMRRLAIRTLGQVDLGPQMAELLSKALKEQDPEAMMEFNKQLENDAKNYFGKMLGKNPLDDKLIGILEQRTGISFKSYDSILDKAEFWRKVDERFTLLLRTIGKYDEEVTTVQDIVKIVDNMSAKQMAEDLSKKFGFEVNENDISENGKIKQNIRDAYLNYQLAQTPVELIERKGTLLGLINGGTADTITIDEFRAALTSGDYSIYKEIFFKNMDLSDEQLKKMSKQINDMIFDGLVTQFVDNLIAMGYSLPLESARSLLYDFLAGKVNVGNEFARKFLYKNNLPDTLSTLNGIITQALPTELRFGYDDMVGFDISKYNKTEYMTRVVEVDNPFMLDTYSELSAMAAIRGGKSMPNTGKEREYLSELLDRYYNKVKELVSSNKKNKFAEVQKLKTQLGYALDMFEQDYIIPRYGRFLSPSERSEILGLKYSIGVTTVEGGLDTVKKYNKAILDRYDSGVKSIIKKNNNFISAAKSAKDLEKEVAARQKELIDQGATMKIINGEVVVIDVREELYRQLLHMPDGVQGLEILKGLGRAGLSKLTNEQAYFLLQLVQLARNADNKMNMITQIIYKMHPELAKIDFFYNFRVIDGLPAVLRGNLLTGTKFLDSLLNTGDFDDKVKRAIFEKIKDVFSSEGVLRRRGTKRGLFKKKEAYISGVDFLSEIIDEAIESNVKELGNSLSKGNLKKLKAEAKRIYMSAFNPYTILENVPSSVISSIDDILARQQKGIRDGMKLLGNDDKLIQVMDGISVQTDFGEIKTFRAILDGSDNNLGKLLFDTETEIVKGAEEAAQRIIPQNANSAKRIAIEEENKEIAKGFENSYNDALKAYLNETEMVGASERALMKRAWISAREIAKQYTLTDMLANMDNRLTTYNEEIMKDFKAFILGFLGNISAGGQWFGLDNVTNDVLAKWGRVKEYYQNLYTMSRSELNNYKPRDVFEGMAWKLAVYFKEIEGGLGSLDGIKGVTTNAQINIAFAHIGEVVMNIKTIEGLFSLMSGIEGNQLLKFFRFSEPGNLSRVNELVIGDVGGYGVGGYRNYVDKTDEGLNKEWFNRTFAANLNDDEYKKIIQALCGFTIINKKRTRFMNFMNFINSSNYLTRALMSYPGQMLTIGMQNIAYWLKQLGWQKELGVESLDEVDDIRKSTGILTGTTNEINFGDATERIRRVLSRTPLDSTDPNIFYNRYGVPDVDGVLKAEKFYDTDDLDTLYAKVDNAAAKSDSDFLTRWFRSTDAYKDNANNIIDGLHTRKFKDIAFLRALQSNNYIQFSTAGQFAAFMASDAPTEMKKKLLDTIKTDSGMHFKNILGLGFSGLDRAVGAGHLRNILSALGQMFNFRGAWGQNIARQTASWINVGYNVIKKYGLSKEGRDALALYIAKQPEFVNFTKQLWNDIHNAWVLSKIQDNGDWVPANNEYDLLDFLQYTYETLQYSSQRWQGLQSYGTTRIGTAWAKSMIQSWVDPETYRDTLGVGALINNMSKNLGRNRKVPNMLIKFFGTLAGNKFDMNIAREFFGHEFWKLSFATLRYIYNEDMGSDGYSYELIGGPEFIPSIITGETNERGDKAYSYDLANTETWLTLTNWWDSLVKGDGHAYTYFCNNLGSFINGSQFLSSIKNVGRTLQPMVPEAIQNIAGDMGIYAMGSPFDAAEIVDTIREETAAGREYISKGYYIPTEAKDIEILVKEVLGQANHRPGNDGFNKSMFNFDKSGHMKNLQESNEKDADMEMLLENIKYKRNDNFEFEKDENGERIINPAWRLHMADVYTHFNDEDYMTQSNYDFINTWVELNNDDPNYMLYKSLLGQGIIGRYVNQQIDAQIDAMNTGMGFKKDQKITKDELEDVGLYDIVYAGLQSVKTNITGTSTPLLEAIVKLDKPSSDAATIKIIERQLAEKGDHETIQKLFKIDEKGEIHLSKKYEEFLKEQAKLSQYLKNGDVDSFMAETASLTNMYRKDDPHGIVTTVLISSRIHRINQANSLTAEQKAKAINTLLVDNYDFIQRHIPEFINEIGDKETVNAYVKQMNESIYDISLIGDSLTKENEKNNSKSGRSASLDISKMSKDLLGKLGRATGNGDGVGGGKSYDYNYVPIKFNGAAILRATAGKGYTPVSSKQVIQEYTPHADFSPKKDINRSVKGPKTQAVTKKKQLSKLETDVENALEAES